MGERVPTVQLQIVVIEDNPADVFLIREALREQGLEFVLHVIEDGSEGVIFARREGQYARGTQPDLIVLDLNLPKHSGKEILKRLRESAELVQVPVAILTSSDSPQDRIEAFALGASRYIRKPSDLEEFMQVGAVLKELLVR